jgi:hypothetical protein
VIRAQSFASESGRSGVIRQRRTRLNHLESNTGGSCTPFAAESDRSESGIRRSRMPVPRSRLVV